MAVPKPKAGVFANEEVTRAVASLYRATTNPRLLQAIQALEFDVSHAVKVWRHLGRMNPNMNLQDAVDEYRAILECIRAEDAEGARRAMRGHIEKARVSMMSLG